MYAPSTLGNRARKPFRYPDPDENTGEPYRVLQMPYGVSALSDTFRAAPAERSVLGF